MHLPYTTLLSYGILKVSGQFTEFHFTQCHYTQPAILPDVNFNLPLLKLPEPLFSRLIIKLPVGLDIKLSQPIMGLYCSSLRHVETSLLWRLLICNWVLERKDQNSSFYLPLLKLPEPLFSQPIIKLTLGIDMKLSQPNMGLYCSSLRHVKTSL